jgi:hypothetical protein
MAPRGKSVAACCGRQQFSFSFPSPRSTNYRFTLFPPQVAIRTEHVPLFAFVVSPLFFPTFIIAFTARSFSSPSLIVDIESDI